MNVKRKVAFLKSEKKKKKYMKKNRERKWDNNWCKRKINRIKKKVNMNIYNFSSHNTNNNQSLVATLKFTVIHATAIMWVCDSGAACVAYNPRCALTSMLHYKLCIRQVKKSNKINK